MWIWKGDVDMSPSALDEVRRWKQQIRREAMRRRDGLAEGEALSHRIFEQLLVLPEYVHARTVLLYLDFRSEVHTRWLLPVLWAEGKRVAVPYCVDDALRLFHVTRLEELAPGMLQILEPRPEWRGVADRRVAPSELDLIIVPGVAFDPRGHRLGYGKGYYDKLLHQIRPDAAKIAVCFECQMVPEIPLLAHDIPMDRVVTEERVYP
jgi:5-formyltetrahydrofolate cyclo-ligase